MHVNCAHPMLSATPCSGSGMTSAAHALHTSWRTRGRALFLVFLLALAALPGPVSAAPRVLVPGIHGIVKRQQGPPSNPGGDGGNNDSSSNNGSINMSVWLPILLVTVVFALFSFIMCVRRCTVSDAGSATARNTPANRGTSGGNAIRPRRRPQRTPSQVSTKSLPPYMKEPGDQELVLFRGPSEAGDDPPPPMPTLTEDDDEHPEMRGATFDIPLDRIESVDTIADASTTNLIRGMSTTVPRPPELDPPEPSRDDRRSGDAHSLDSAGSEAELLHTRGWQDDSVDSRGEAPAYSEVVSAMATVSLNDPEPHRDVPSTLVPGRGRPRYSFLTHNPFGSHNHSNGGSSHDNHSTRSESPAQHTRSGSTLSRLSTRESHDSHHSRTPSRNNNVARSRSHSRSSSHLLRGFRSHSPGLHAGSSTISLESISAPLTHTVTRAEFYAPKGGLMTAEQIKLITSREALERFGTPYGPDALAVYSQSRERPPPDFDSVGGEEAQASGGGEVMERSNELGADTVMPRSTSPLEASSVCERAVSHASTDASYETAAELEWQAQVVRAYGSGELEEGEMDEPRTARPMTPSTVRSFGPPR